MRISFIILLLSLLCTMNYALAQDSSGRLVIPAKAIESMKKKAGKLQLQLDHKSEKALASLQKQEYRLQQKLQRIDSVKAKEIFADTHKIIDAQPKKLTSYIPSLDTLSSALNFLKSTPQLTTTISTATSKLDQAAEKVQALKDQFQKAESVKQYLKERRQYLKDQLSTLGFAREFKKINKDIYYYSQQINEYKSLLKDHTKAEKKAIELLSKTKLFQDFMRKNSQLASLFRLPDPGNQASMASLAGLQTRAQVNRLIQQQIAAGGPNAQAQVTQNIQAAQSQLNAIKNKMMGLASRSSGDEMPEGFKPNTQKTKGILKRLEYGFNIQSQKATNFFPTTTDLGLSLGYKLNDRSRIGIGASYKAGLGRGWNHIRFTSEGVGLRSFIDWKIKGSFWMSGGYEQNYRSAFQNIDQLKDKNRWQQSGLIGVSKVISLKTKFFKQTKLQLLWDVLSYRQIPQTQPIVFRVNYSL